MYVHLLNKYFALDCTRLFVAFTFPKMYIIIQGGYRLNKKIFVNAIGRV